MPQRDRKCGNCGATVTLEEGHACVKQLTPAERARRDERLNTLADTAKKIAGGWLPLSVKYDVAQKMLDGLEAWEAERGRVDRYVTTPYEQ